MSKLFTADYRQQGTSELVFSCTPTLAKRSASLQIQDYLLSPHDVPKHIPQQDIIAASTETMPLLMQRELGGTVKDEECKLGNIIISPAGVSHSASWDRAISVTLLIFDPKYIPMFAYEDIDPDSVKLLPHFAQPDPLIHAMTMALVTHADDQLYVDSAASHLAAHLLRNYCAVEHKLTEGNGDALSRSDLSQVIDYIEVHLDQKLGLAELSNLLGFSDSHFGRLFKGATGVSPAQYIIDRRVVRATHLLANTSLSLGTIAQRSGFSHYTHFSSAFTKRNRVSPAQYRKML
jgi:AraC family transcriptional regulator